MECIIVKMYIHHKKDYYLVSFDDFKKYKNGSGFLPYILKNKFKKNIIYMLKENDYYKNLNIKLVKEV